MTNKNKAAQKRGVTLIEIAIVLVIIGILLGGVLKGQELINNARVRAMSDQQNSIKVAWFSFLDRFQAMPADYQFAPQYIRESVTVTTTGDGIIQENESPLVWQQLVAAGYLRCQQCTGVSAVAAPAVNNSLLNAYGGVMAIFHNTVTYATDEGAAPTDSRLMINAGNLIPSNIAAEVDLKVDDSIANQGEIVFNSWKGAGVVPPVANCLSSNRTSLTGGALFLATAGAQLFYRPAVVNPDPNCGISNAL